MRGLPHLFIAGNASPPVRAGATGLHLNRGSRALRTGPKSSKGSNLPAGQKSQPKGHGPNQRRERQRWEGPQDLTWCPWPGSDLRASRHAPTCHTSSLDWPRFSTRTLYVTGQRSQWQVAYLTSCPSGTGVSVWATRSLNSVWDHTQIASFANAGIRYCGVATVDVEARAVHSGLCTL